VLFHCAARQTASMAGSLDPPANGDTYCRFLLRRQNAVSICSALDNQLGRQPGSAANGDGRDGGRPWARPRRQRQRQQQQPHWRQPPGGDEFGTPSWAMDPEQQSYDSGLYDGTI